MTQKNTQQLIKRLTLMLLHLTSWEDDEIGLHVMRSWKGYDFGVLDELADEDFIRGGHRSKSVILTEKGIKKAKELLTQYQFDRE